MQYLIIIILDWVRGARGNMEEYCHRAKNADGLAIKRCSSPPRPPPYSLGKFITIKGLVTKLTGTELIRTVPRSS